MLQPIEQRLVDTFSKCQKVRWIGPNGAWCRGLLIHSCDGPYRTHVIINEHKRESVVLLDGEFECDGLRDDKGELVSDLIA